MSTHGEIPCGKWWLDALWGHFLVLGSSVTNISALPPAPAEPSEALLTGYKQSQTQTWRRRDAPLAEGACCPLCGSRSLGLFCAWSRWIFCTHILPLHSGLHHFTYSENSPAWNPFGSKRASQPRWGRQFVGTGALVLSKVWDPGLMSNLCVCIRRNFAFFT